MRKGLKEGERDIPHADRMKRPQHNPIRPLTPQEPFQSNAHLLGSLVGERDRDDVLRLVEFCADEVGDPGSDYAGLALGRAQSGRRKEKRGSAPFGGVRYSDWGEWTNLILDQRGSVEGQQGRA